nr:uncharacterized protein LOC127346945 [Lolium perenne]
MRNWLHNPRDDKESIRIVGFININREETNLCAEDLVRVFLARRVLPLQRRAHKISEMSGPMDPTRITTHRLSPTDLVLKAKQICQNPLSSSGSTSAGRAAPKPPQHRAEEKHVSPPKTQDTGASNIGAGAEDIGQGEPLVPPVPKKKKKNTASSPSKVVPDSSGPASSSPAKEVHGASAPSRAPTPPPAASTGGPAPAPSSLVLHASHTSVVAGESASAQLGRITELTRGGVELGHLTDYAHKWNQADLSPATCGLGKDKLPVADPAGPRSTVQHLGRLRRAVKEFDIAWHDANNNVVSTATTRRQLFEELLWEHRELSEAHSQCQD